MAFFWCALTGYLVGCISPSYLLSRLRGFDIRKRGSGNAGAANAVITMGAKAGLITALADIFKAFFAVRLMCGLMPEYIYSYEVTSVSCILGHIFPVTMHFKGGKGLACLGGVILAFNGWIFAAMLAGELVLALLVDYICVVPITASVLFPLIYARMTGQVSGACILGIAAVVMLLRHRENLQRIAKGTEMHFSYLWNGEKEAQRLTGKSYAAARADMDSGAMDFTDVAEADQPAISPSPAEGPETSAGT